MTLELQAMRYLRFEKSCPLAFFQRTPRLDGRQPDAIGIMEARYLIEIEIKRSASDFRADRAKRHVINREYFLEQWPRQFYYLMPDGLAGKLESELPEWAGLLAAEIESPFRRRVVRSAPVNRASKRLTVKETIRLVRVLGNQILSQEMALDRRRLEGTSESRWPIEYEI